jgi:hypothetical protein
MTSPEKVLQSLVDLLRPFQENQRGGLAPSSSSQPEIEAKCPRLQRRSRPISRLFLCIIVFSVLPLSSCNNPGPVTSTPAQVNDSSLPSAKASVPSTHSFDVTLAALPPADVHIRLDGSSKFERILTKGDPPTATFALPPGDWDLRIRAEGCKTFTFAFTMPGTDGITASLVPIPNYWQNKKSAERRAAVREQEAKKRRLHEAEVARKKQAAVAAAQPTVTYEVVEEEDFSLKAFGGRLASEFTLQEIERLPKAYRKAYRIVVHPAALTEQEVRSVAENLLADVTAQDRDIDAITIWLYSNKSLVGLAADVAIVTWGPEGNWGGVTSDIASSNNRDSYQIVVEMTGAN